MLTRWCYACCSCLLTALPCVQYTKGIDVHVWEPDMECVHGIGMHSGVLERARKVHGTAQAKKDAETRAFRREIDRLQLQHRDRAPRRARSASGQGAVEQQLPVDDSGKDTAADELLDVDAEGASAQCHCSGCRGLRPATDDVSFRPLSECPCVIVTAQAMQDMAHVRCARADVCTR